MLSNKLFKSFFVCISCTLLIACLYQRDPLNSFNYADDVTRIDIKEREHGYHNFKSMVITTSDSLNHFLDMVARQPAWNDKDIFIDILTAAAIDFSTHNLLLIRHTEGSGSNQVSIGKPCLSAQKLTFDIKRHVPSIGTTDMAYYCFAYMVPTEYESILIQVEGKTDTLITID